MNDGGFPASVGQVAEFIGAQVEGDAALMLSGVAALEAAGPEELSWVASDKQLPRLADSRAGAVLVPIHVKISGRTLLRAGDVDLALCGLLGHFGPPAERVPAGAHPSAIIAPGAQVHASAGIGPFVTIGSGAVVGAGVQVHVGVRIGDRAQIGAECILWQNVVIREDVRIGQRVIIHPNATIGSDGFGYVHRDGRHVKIPHIGTVELEDDVEVGANTAIDRAKTGVTRVGRGTKIDNLVQIGHNCEIGPGSILVGQVGLSGSCRLGAGVTLAGQVGVADHVRIGDRCVVTAKAGVFSDLPPGGVSGGTPATEQAAYIRQAMAARRLPRVLEKVRELSKRVQRLESSADDSA